MKNFKKIIFVLLLNLIYTNIFPGLLPDTKVFVGIMYGKRAYQKAKNLAVGDCIPVYDIATLSIYKDAQKIVGISTKKTNSIVLIETDDDLVVVGLEQKLYNRRITQFIPAQEFKPGDMLFAVDKGNLLVKNVTIQNLEEKIKLYEISLEDKDLFLILSEGKKHILVHNFPFPVALFTYALGGELLALAGKILISTAATVGSAIGLIALHKKAKNNNPHKEKKPNPDLDNILKDTNKAKKQKGDADVYIKKGGKEQKEMDFNELNKGKEIKTVTKEGKPIRFGQTQNGEQIVDRDFSSERSENKPTLEIQHGKNNCTKIRYED